MKRLIGKLPALRMFNQSINVLPERVIGALAG